MPCAHIFRLLLNPVQPAIGPAHAKNTLNGRKVERIQLLDPDKQGVVPLQSDTLFFQLIIDLAAAEQNLPAWRRKYRQAGQYRSGKCRHNIGQRSNCRPDGATDSSA